MAKFSYIALPGADGKAVYKPLIKARLIYRKTHKLTNPIYALIDSGADVSFCEKNIGIWLGINFSKLKKERFRAANNKYFISLKEILSLNTANKSYTCPFYFADTLAYPIILGQKGFFDHFKIIFDLKNKEIEVT